MKRKRILFVDDDVTLVETFKKILENEGYVVEVALTGHQAFEKVDEVEFDLIILDIRLPDIIGEEVARKVREQDETVNIVMITGYPDFQDSINALDIGVHDILLKPIGPDELLRVTREALSDT